MHLRSDKSDCAAFILVGGKSSRMGTDKAFVMLNGRTLLRHALTVSAVTATVILWARARSSRSSLLSSRMFSRLRTDREEFTPRSSSASDLNLILAVDVPFVPPDLLRYLLAQAKSHEAMQSRLFLHPPRLAAALRRLSPRRKSFLPAAEAALRAGNYKIDALFSKIKVLAVEEGELAVRGFSPGAFRNLNTQEELIAAKRIARYGDNKLNGRDSTPSTPQSAAEGAPLVPYIEFAATFRKPSAITFSTT